MLSALPPKADIHELVGHVRLVPIGDIHVEHRPGPAQSRPPSLFPQQFVATAHGRL